MKPSQISRRTFLQRAGAGPLATLGTGLGTPEARAAAAHAREIIGTLKL